MIFTGMLSFLLWASLSKIGTILISYCFWSNEIEENVDQLVWQNLLPDSSYHKLLFLFSGVVHD